MLSASHRSSADSCYISWEPSSDDLWEFTGQGVRRRGRKSLDIGFEQRDQGPTCSAVSCPRAPLWFTGVEKVSLSAECTGCKQHALVSCRSVAARAPSESTLHRPCGTLSSGLGQARLEHPPLQDHRAGTFTVDNVAFVQVFLNTRVPRKDHDIAPLSDN